MVPWHHTLCPRRASRDFGTNLLSTIQLKSSSTRIFFFPFACLVWQHAACNTSSYYQDYYSRSPQHCNHILYSACESTIMGLIEAWKYFTLILSYIIFHSLMSGQSDLWVRLSVTCQGLTWAGGIGEAKRVPDRSDGWQRKRGVEKIEEDYEEEKVNERERK